MLWHRHHWEVTGAQPIAMYGDGWGGMTEFPTSEFTHVALRCSGCGDVKVRRIRGGFVLSDGVLTAVSNRQVRP